MPNRTDIVVETDNAEGQVLLSASRVYDLTEDKTQDTINSEVGSSLTSLGNTLNLLYRVGSIYISTDSTSPASLFGGTWERIKDRFLLAAGTTYAAGNTGGEASHILTTSELPSHTHSIPALSGTASSTNSKHDHGINSAIGYASGGVKLAQGSEAFSLLTTTTSSGAHSHSVSTTASTTGSKGDGTAHNNMPPYLAIYMWKRVA